MSNAYLTYAAKRLGQAIVVILLAYVFTFVVVSVLPGDPISTFCATRRTALPSRRSPKSLRHRGWTGRSSCSSGTPCRPS